LTEQFEPILTQPTHHDEPDTEGALAAGAVAPLPARRVAPGHDHGGEAQSLAFAFSLIDRLEELLDGETGSLRSYSIGELKELNHRKSQCLLELVRASRTLENQPSNPALVERLTTLRRALDRNQAALQTHVDAVKEIAGIISDTMRDRESDGTYDERPALRA
jgi:hypothetical protein